mmetsp:Transcript_86111/g.266646  ORF Transcript_86111/g.266646 Transcript_86111/m.266646 type:complete len:234 (-) Transcript_86111:35-736(-)
MRAAAQQQAQQSAHRLTHAAIAGSAVRAASRQRRPTTPSNGSTRAPSAGSTASSLDARRMQIPSGSQAPDADEDDDGSEATSVTAPSSAGTTSSTGNAGNLPAASPDTLDMWVLREELCRTSNALARAVAAPEVVSSLDLPGLAALRTELVAAHAAALERIDDRRVCLQARQASAQEGPERGRCVACWTRSADRVLLPCRHLCLCGACLRSCRTSCPICRAPVKDALEVFGAA